MKLKSYLILWLEVIGTLLLFTGTPVSAASYHDFLRINKVYVLYTDPIVPHRDTAGNFWIGLEPFTWLLGAKFQNSADGSETVIYRGHRLVFTDGAMTASLDGKSIPLPVAAKRIGKSHQMVAPLVPLLMAFRLRYDWNEHFHVLTLTEEEVLHGGAAGELSDSVLQLEGPPIGYPVKVRAFTGPPFSLYPIVPILYVQHRKIVEWDLKNVSNTDIPTAFIGEETDGYDYYDTRTDAFRIPQSIPQTYMIRAHRVFKYAYPILGTSSHLPLRYVIGRIAP